MPCGRRVSVGRRAAGGGPRGRYELGGLTEYREDAEAATVEQRLATTRLAIRKRRRKKRHTQSRCIYSLCIICAVLFYAYMQQHICAVPETPMTKMIIVSILETSGVSGTIETLNQLKASSFSSRAVGALLRHRHNTGNVIRRPLPNPVLLPRPASSYSWSQQSYNDT